ncbi:DNA repair protein RecO [Candidatus Falkowbacteria bacterium]|nr:DNA repair protein RecO [Candidatus Falkowbacteria bacterium]
MSTILTQGIILKTEHQGDYDRRYTIYTLDLGKITAIAKGAKKIVSKLSPHLGQFLIIDLMLANGQSCQRIAAAQVHKNYSAIKNDLSKIIMALYFLETIDLLIKYDYPDKAVFAIINEFLFNLSISDYKENNFLILNKYFYHLLKYLGYQPILKAKNQKQLFYDLHRLAVETAERGVKSFGLLEKII